MDTPEAPTVLLVEDCASDVYLIRSALEQHGVPHRLRVLNNGEDAIQYLRQANEPGSPHAAPAVLLLDLNMPRRNGREVLEELHRLDSAGSTKTIVMTSFSSPMERAELARLGAHTIFTKPSDLDAFLDLGKLVRGALEV